MSDIQIVIVMVFQIKVHLWIKSCLKFWHFWHENNEGTQFIQESKSRLVPREKRQFNCTNWTVALFWSENVVYIYWAVVMHMGSLTSLLTVLSVFQNPKSFTHIPIVPEYSWQISQVDRWKRLNLGEKLTLWVESEV